MNQTQDDRGCHNALQGWFTMHELNHAHWMVAHDDQFAVAKLGEDVPDWRAEGAGVKPAQKDTVIAP